MKTQVAVAIDASSDGVRCGEAVARAALSKLGAGEIALALLFCSHPEPGKVAIGVNRVLQGVPLIGANSAGEYTHDGYVEDGAGLMLIRSDSVRFHPLSYRRRWFGRGKLLGRLTGLSDQGLGSTFHHRALVLFPDDRSMKLDGLVTRAMEETAMLYDILGGPGPSIPKPPRDPALFFNRLLLKNGMVGAEVLSQQRFGFSVANGWRPLAGPYRATEVDEKSIVKIDGRPAREVYEDFLSTQGYYNPANISQETLLRFPIGNCQNEDCKVSVIMEIDQRGALLMTSPPQENSLIQILTTEGAAMTAAADRAIVDALGQLQEPKAAGLLFIDCMSTAMVLDKAYVRQREAAQRRAGDLPFLGFRSHGVLARLQGQTAGHFECSVGACVIPE